MKYISFPSKTFLIGEYAVLEKAPAILVNTQPRFWFAIESKAVIASSCSSFKDFHPDSPAGQWLKCYPEINSKYSIQCWDPHLGQGGFGLSSVQFNLMYYLTVCQAQLKNLSQNELLKMWSSYRKLNFEGHIPSGADIISQWLGQVCVFSSDPFTARSMSWPFADLAFVLVRTGVKMQTWQYLKHFSRSVPKLVELSHQAVSYINTPNQSRFVAIIDEYNFHLQKWDLVHQTTQKILQKIQAENSPIITAKGCGAMGAEVICAFYHPKDKLQVKALFQQEHIVADSQDLTDGIKEHTADEWPHQWKPFSSSN